MNKNLSSISLEFREGTSDKVYKVAIEKSGKGFVVQFAFGRRESALQTGTKTQFPIPLEEAEKIYEKLVFSKMAKGYKIQVGVEGIGLSITNSVIDKDQRDTGLRPQLLNSITEEEAEIYLTNDNWYAQEKFDGKRMTIKKNSSEIVAANKKGLTIGFPDTMASELSALKIDFVVDGEAIGETFHAFDILQHSTDDLRQQPYIHRLDILDGLIKGTHIVIAKTAMGTTDKRKMMAKLKALGKEGIVFKKLSAKWYAGRPASGGSAVKCKFYKTASVIVLKVNTKRSVVMGVLDGKNIIQIGSVTIGPNKEIPSVSSLVEVRYLYAYKGGSLYQPTYIQDRSDELDRKECVIGQLVYKAEINEG